MEEEAFLYVLFIFSIGQNLSSFPSEGEGGREDRGVLFFKKR